jgi:hypothetical protein
MTEDSDAEIATTASAERARELIGRDRPARARRNLFLLD